MKKATVVVTRYNESDKIVSACLKCLAEQNNVELQILFLDQKESSTIKAECKFLSKSQNKIFYKKIPAKSLSFARNLGIQLAKEEIVLFTDSDALPDKNWASEIIDTYSKDKKIGIVGGKVIPYFENKPKWYSRAKFAMEMYSIINLPRDIGEVEKVVGVNFSLNKKRLGDMAIFLENLGRKNGKLLGGEETDLCQKIIEKRFKVYYNSNALVKHFIPKERNSLIWLTRRAYWGGYSRAIRGGKPKRFDSTKTKYDNLFIPIILPFYAAGYFKGKVGW